MTRLFPILLVFILAACSTNSLGAENTAIGVLSATSTTQVKPTATVIASQTVSSTNTNTPPPTATTTLTSTPTPFPSSTPTYPSTVASTATKTLSPTPTLSPEEDLDSDGLTNYEETVKYKTDPNNDDSDGDGIKDSDWNERQEYSYTVHIIMKIREPFDVNTMNDFFQDVKILEGPDANEYSTIDVIIYPNTKLVFFESPYPLTGLPQDIQLFTEPGIATNFDTDMQEEVLNIVAGADTDLQAVNRILEWVNTETSLNFDGSIPEVYYTYLDGENVRTRSYNGPLSVDELLRTQYYALSMFNERTHGTCTSIATLKCAMLKVAGIPCRLIQTIFPIYYHPSQTVPYENNLNRGWGCSFEQSLGQDAWWTNHSFIEVYLDGMWVRADENVNIYHEFGCLSVKILSVSDWSEVDFSKTWPVSWIYQRPYYTLLVEDHEPIH